MLYCILLTVGLLFYRFPSDAFREYFQSIADSINPRFLFFIEKTLPSFPFGLNLLHPSLSFKAKPNVRLFVAESLLIRPDLKSFLKEESKYYFDCLAYDGDLKGNIRLKKNSKKAHFTTSIKLKNICIDDFARFSDLMGSNVRGTFGGSIRYSGYFHFLIDGIGEANLRISDGHVELLHPFLNFTSIDFDEMRIKMALENQTIDLVSVDLIGQGIHGALSGTVSLKKKILESQLNLKGTIVLLAGLYNLNKDTSKTLGLIFQNQQSKKLSFIIYGTLTEPRLTFI